MEDTFRTSAGSLVTIPQIVEETIAYMNADPHRHYKVIVGTDSALFPDFSADFVTAIVVHRVGNGGRYFWRRQESEKFYTLRDRIIREVLLSIEASKNLLEVLQGDGVPPFDFEIHVDIGEKGDTKEMLHEVTGMIRAYNFEARTKPDSYAASKVADRHV